MLFGGDTEEGEEQIPMTFADSLVLSESQKQKKHFFKWGVKTIYRYLGIFFEIEV